MAGGGDSIFKNILNDTNIKEVCEFLSPYTSRIFVVGGAVRDSILAGSDAAKMDIKDYDLEIYDISPKLFDELMARLGAQALGRAFFVYKYRNLDLALPRRESKTSYGHAGFSASVINDEREASTRRDFTINALMLNAITGELLDLHGGVSDLKSRTLRVVSSQTFADDSLRVLRGVQFAARFGLVADEASLPEMRKCDISDLSGERVSGELMKFFDAPKKAFGVNILRATGLDLRLFGVKLSEDFAALTDMHFQNATTSAKELIFLYDLVHFFAVSGAAKMLKSLHLPNKFRRILSEPFYQNVGDFELMQTALLMPLKEWLGLHSAALINRAKELNIYEEKFTPKIDLSAINELSGKARGEAIQSLKLTAIKEHLGGVRLC